MNEPPDLLTAPAMLVLFDACTHPESALRAITALVEMTSLVRTIPHGKAQKAYEVGQLAIEDILVRMSEAMAAGTATPPVGGTNVSAS